MSGNLFCVSSYHKYQSVLSYKEETLRDVFTLLY